MQKFEKSEGKAKNAQSFYQKYLKIARYSFYIFGSNLTHFWLSEYNILNRTQVIILLFLLPFYAFTQVKTIGTPNIHNYPKTVYKAGTQNWDVAQDANGFMYFANNDGVLRFDGISWDLLSVPTTPVRSIIVDSNNRIFVGLSNDFGLFEKNENGIYEFKSLKHLLLDDVKVFTEVWRIHEIRQGIVFQTFEYSFLLNNNEIEVLKPKNRFLFSFNVDGRLFIQEPGIGLFEYFNWSVEQVPWDKELRDKEIWTILHLGDNQLLIGTVGYGFYKYNRGALTKWNTPASNFIIENKLYSATRLPGNYFAFGSILEGMIICDNDGNIIQRINRSNGLQNNTVLSLFNDKNGNLWMGLDNGIDYVEVNSPISFFSLTDGIGTGYCCRVHDDNLYLGTNQGLFVRPFKRYMQNNNEPFKLVENTVGQVWSLGVFGNQMICGHNLGTFIVEGKTARKISDELGAWKYIQVKEYPNILIGGHYNGLILLKKGKNGWEFYKKIKGFNESSRFICRDDGGNIWVSHWRRGVFKLQLNVELDSVVNQKTYIAKDGLPHNEHNIILSFGESWYVSGIDGLYKYQKSNDRFLKDAELNKVFDVNDRIKFVETDNQDDLWYIAEDETGLIHRNEDFTFTKITEPFKQLNDRLVNEFEFLYPLSNDNVFIGLEDGFAHYSARIIKSYTDPFKAFITRVELPNIDSIIYSSGVKQAEHKFPFRRNAFRFYFTAPFYENPSQLEFSYFIENYSSEWSPWVADSYRDFTNLPENDYVFKVKAKNIYEVESDIASFSFTVLPPWYRSKLAYYAYVFLVFSLAFLVTRMIKKNVEKSKDKQRIKHNEELTKKEQEFNQQALITDKEIMKLRNDKLEGEKIFLDKELANQTMSIIQKNKFLMKLNQELKRLQDETLSSSVKTKLVIIKKRIDKEIDSEQQNKVFESYFDEVHTDFFKRLKEAYPQLSPKDLRLSAYIRMNISTKEIATLLNISDRGVEISRYRLRKKIVLPRDVNLSTFLSNI